MELGRLLADVDMGLGNRVWISLLAFVPFGFLVMPFVLGATGSQRAWQKKRWQSLEHFRRVQRRWAIAGWIWIGVLVAGAASAVLVNGPSDSPDAEQVLSNENGDLQIAVPTSWDDLTGELNEVASIEASNPLEDAYVIVIEEFKADYADEMSLSRFAKLTTSQMSAGLEAGRVTEGPVPQSIRGNHALRHVIEGTIDGLNVTYMHVSIETPRRLLQVITWSRRTSFEEYRSLFLEVAVKPPGALIHAPTWSSGTCACLYPITPPLESSKNKADETLGTAIYDGRYRGIGPLG